ncbi:MAG: cobalt ECF transporter T component CbiQ [Fibromonadaceae bacterium]|jgi:cobalt/nickel transport system permease protein|nr:cobalt ECF transporter T component CbiQ [Fibromonadaceae bacterium]
MIGKIQELSALERLSGGDTYVHRLHPMVKLFATAVFIITVISFGRHAFILLIPYVFFLIFLMILSKTPHLILFKRFLIAFPFCFFAGISNVIFEPAPYGLISFFTIMLRAYLCVMAALLLVSVTPFYEIANSMRRLKIPGIFVSIFEMTYRYISVLLEEVYSMYIAYSLRNAGKKGIRMRDMGSFAGQLLLRSFDRADRVYNAMKCRGYTLDFVPQNRQSFLPKDIVFFIFVCIFCLTFRLIIPFIPTVLLS